MAALLELLLFAYSIHSLRSTQVTLSNTEPRLDTNGDIINAHDGVVQQWESNGKFYWYSIGYSLCTEPSGQNGCADAGVNNSCGFQYNHSVNLYMSSDLTSGSWHFVANVLPLDSRYTHCHAQFKLEHNWSTAPAQSNGHYVCAVGGVQRPLAAIRALRQLPAHNRLLKEPLLGGDGEQSGGSLFDA